MKTFEMFRKHNDIRNTGISVFKIQKEEEHSEEEQQEEEKEEYQQEEQQEEEDRQEEGDQQEAPNKSKIKYEQDLSQSEEENLSRDVEADLQAVSDQLDADFEKLKEAFLIFLLGAACKSKFEFVTVYDCKEIQKINNLAESSDLKFLGEIPALDNYNLNAFCKKIYKTLSKKEDEKKIRVLMLTNIKGTQDSCLSNLIMFLKKMTSRYIIILLNKNEMSALFSKIPAGLVKFEEVNHFECELNFYEHYLNTWEKILGKEFSRFNLAEIKGCIVPLKETLSYSTIKNQMKLATLFFKNCKSNKNYKKFREILEKIKPKENLLNMTKPNIPQIIYEDIQQMNKLLLTFKPPRKMNLDDIDYVKRVKYVYRTFLRNYGFAEERVSLAQFFARIVEDNEEEPDLKLVSKLVHEYYIHHLIRLEQDCQVVRKMLFN